MSLLRSSWAIVSSMSSAVELSDWKQLRAISVKVCFPVERYLVIFSLMSELFMVFSVICVGVWDFFPGIFSGKFFRLRGASLVRGCMCEYMRGVWVACVRARVHDVCAGAWCA